MSTLGLSLFFFAAVAVVVLLLLPRGAAPLSVMTTTPTTTTPPLTLGVVADVQHADKEDLPDEGERCLFYRSAVEKLARCVSVFGEAQVSGVLNLGDTIDGNVDDETTAADLERVAAQFDRIAPCYHVVGNHCLSVDRGVLQRRLKMAAPYYAVDLSETWRLVVCDTNDLGLGWAPGTPERDAAEAYLLANPLDRERPQMTPWNGGVGSDQLAWLRSELASASASASASSKKKKNLVVASHHPFAPEAATPKHVAWNFNEVRDLLLQSPNVRLVVAGHYHPGGYARDSSSGLHFVTLEGMVEAKDTAFAFLDLYEDRAVLRARGSATSRELPFPSS